MNPKHANLFRPQPPVRRSRRPGTIRLYGLAPRLTGASHSADQYEGRSAWRDKGDWLWRRASKCRWWKPARRTTRSSSRSCGGRSRTLAEQGVLPAAGGNRAGHPVGTGPGRLALHVPGAAVDRFARLLCLRRVRIRRMDAPDSPGGPPEGPPGAERRAVARPGSGPAPPGDRRRPARGVDAQHRHQPRALFASQAAARLHGQHHRGRRSRAVAGAPRRRAGAVQQGPGGFRLRGLPRFTGTAEDGLLLHGSAGGTLPRAFGCRRRRVHRLHYRRRGPDAGADPRSSRLLARLDPGAPDCAHQQRRGAGPGADQRARRHCRERRHH